MSTRNKELYTVPVAPIHAFNLMYEGETLLMLTDSTPEEYLYIFYRYGDFHVVSPETTPQPTTLKEKDLLWYDFYKIEEKSTEPTASPSDDSIVFQSNKGENLATFVFRLWNAAHKLDRPVSGNYSGGEGALYIGDVKKTDDPVSIVKSFTGKYEKARKHPQDP